MQAIYQSQQFMWMTKWHWVRFFFWILWCPPLMLQTRLSQSLRYMIILSLQSWSLVGASSLAWDLAELKNKNFNLISWWCKNSYFIHNYSINFYVCLPILLCTVYKFIQCLEVFIWGSISCCSNNPYISLFHLFLVIHPFSTPDTTSACCHGLHSRFSSSVFITAFVCGSSLLTFL
jgi:hypothetical protein